MTKFIKKSAIIMVFATFAAGLAVQAQNVGQMPLVLAQTAPAKAKFEKVNMDKGGGVFEPVLRITPPTGAPIIIRVGEHGLTRSILFNSKDLRAFGRSFLKTKKG